MTTDIPDEGGQAQREEAVMIWIWTYRFGFWTPRIGTKLPDAGFARLVRRRSDLLLEAN